MLSPTERERERERERENEERERENEERERESRAVVVAQLAEQLLPTYEYLGSNSVIGIFLTFIYCQVFKIGKEKA